MNSLRIVVAACGLIATAISKGAEAASLASGETLQVKIKLKTGDDEMKRLWDRFGGWCAIAEWHPAVRSCTEGKEGGEVYRLLSLKDGGKIKEKLIETGPLAYRYSIVESPLPVKNYEAKFSITPDKNDAGEIDVVWTASYDAADGNDDAKARATIDGIFKDGIASIKAKVPTIPEPSEPTNKAVAP